METREQQQETTATAVVDDKASYVLTGVGTVTVEAVREDLARLLGEQRIRIEIGVLVLFITRDAIPALIAQLLAVQSMTPVNA